MYPKNECATQAMKRFASVIEAEIAYFIADYNAGSSDLLHEIVHSISTHVQAELCANCAMADGSGGHSALWARNCGVSGDPLAV